MERDAASAVQSSTVQPIRIVEVGPRDGLQNESRIVPTAAKVDFINELGRTGVVEIEAGSFVSPKWIPQLADSAEVLKSILRVAGVKYSALVPNEKGFERALECHVDKIAVFTAASETFNRKNINASIAESIDRFRPVVERAKREDLPVRAYVSTAFYCPFEGKIDPSKIVEVAGMLVDLGVLEISIGDTIGKAVPNDVRSLLDKLLTRTAPGVLALHFHDTYGTSISNILAAWEEYGIRTFDTSAGGLGGCPYAPGATGNVATEDVVFALENSGARVSVDAAAAARAAWKIAAHLGRDLTSHAAARFRPKGNEA
ncbi:MAG: hydroxymethylglutaryl-CoA lyase [Nitrospirae bacterium]|nr:hydroxymethylglutaryl-CoA lyase [Nitrospirota bacterium]